VKFTWPAGFDIPDTVWIESGMVRFRRRGLSYPCSQIVEMLAVSAIEPPVRNAGTPFFDEQRLRAVLRALSTGDALPPISVYVAARGQHRYRVRDGFHRYYASAAAGYPFIPISVAEPPFEFETEPIPR
jgi:hypothetical protein